MSVRRLAEDSVQPGGFAFTGANAAWAQETIRKYPEGRQQSAVIPLLMRAQDQEGWVTRAAIEHVADMLAMPLIRVLEVATFYTQFQLKPVGSRAHVQVCGTTPCMLRGADDLKAICKKRIHPDQFQRNADGTLSWEEVECLGACVNAPMVMIGHDTYEDLTAERLEEIIDLFEGGEGAKVKPGPQIDRHLSAPVGGLTSLTSFEAQEGAEAGASGATGEEPGVQRGGGAHVSQTSAAGRPDTEAEETNPTLDAPGKAAPEEDVPPSHEEYVSDELVSEAEAGIGGQEGGTERGPTDTGEEDAAHRGTVEASTPGGRREGNFGEKERLAEDLTVADKYRPDASQSSEPGFSREGVDLTGADHAHAPPEGTRVTSDTETGPAFHDHFDSKAEEDRRESDASDSEGTLETRPHPEMGRRPENLLREPEGEPDDLKAIKGIGPVLEDRLNELGVFHVRQIAAWDEQELIWIDDHLNFRGRAIRDRWLDQARALMSGAD